MEMLYLLFLVVSLIGLLVGFGLAMFCYEERELVKKHAFLVSNILFGLAMLYAFLILFNLGEVLFAFAVLCLFLFILVLVLSWTLAWKNLFLRKILDFFESFFDNYFKNFSFQIFFLCFELILLTAIYIWSYFILPIYFVTESSLVVLENNFFLLFAALIMVFNIAFGLVLHDEFIGVKVNRAVNKAVNKTVNKSVKAAVKLKK